MRIYSTKPIPHWLVEHRLAERWHPWVPRAGIMLVLMAPPLGVLSSLLFEDMGLSKIGVLVVGIAVCVFLFTLGWFLGSLTWSPSRPFMSVYDDHIDVWQPLEENKPGAWLSFRNEDLLALRTKDNIAILEVRGVEIPSVELPLHLAKEPDRAEAIRTLEDRIAANAGDASEET